MCILSQLVFLSKLWAPNRLWSLWNILLARKGCLLYPCLCTVTNVDWVLGRSQWNLILVKSLLWLFCVRSTAIFLPWMEHVSSWPWLFLSGSINHGVQSCCVSLCEFLVEGHGFVVAVVALGLLVGTLPGLLTQLTLFKRRGQSSAILTKTTILVKSYLALIVIKQAATCLGRQRSAKVFFTTGWARWSVTSWASLWRMRSGDRRHDKERRWRFLDLLVWLVYAADERIYQFVSRSQRQPLYE